MFDADWPRNWSFLTNDLIKLAPPEDAVLQQYLDENSDDFRDSDLLTFTQIYIDPDERGNAAIAYAESLLADLDTLGPPDESTLEKGDRFMLQNKFTNAPEFEIQRQMGKEFADSVMQLESGRWHGPVLSGYGMHLVYVAEHIAASDPVLADVRDRVLVEYTREQTEEFNAEYLRVLRSRYTIIGLEFLDTLQDKPANETTP